MELEIIAHRGFSSIAPENTLAAFNAALQHHANSIEFDVQLSADGVPVIFHDAKFDRILGINDKLREKTLAELKTIDVGSWFSEEFRGETIPTLEETLTLIKDIKNYIYFDVKPYYDWSESEIDNFLQIINKQGIKHKCVITSFNDKFIEKVRNQSQDMLFGRLVGNYEDYTIQLTKAIAAIDPLISTQYRILFDYPELIKTTRNHGIDIVAWTVDSPQDFQKLNDLGIFRIVTNSLIY